MLAAHVLVWGLLYCPIIGGIGSSRSGRLKSLMSTSSNSASLRSCAIAWTHLATASALRPGRVLPMTMAILIMHVSCAVPGRGGDTSSQPLQQMHHAPASSPRDDARDAQESHRHQRTSADDEQVRRNSRGHHAGEHE